MCRSRKRLFRELNLFQLEMVSIHNCSRATLSFRQREREKKHSISLVLCYSTFMCCWFLNWAVHNTWHMPSPMSHLSLWPQLSLFWALNWVHLAMLALVFHRCLCHCKKSLKTSEASRGIPSGNFVSISNCKVMKIKRPSGPCDGTPG